MSNAPYRPAPDADTGRIHKTVTYAFSHYDADAHSHFLDEMWAQGWEVISTSVYQQTEYQYYVAVTYRRRQP